MFSRTLNNEFYKTSVRNQVRNLCPSLSSTAINNHQPSWLYDLRGLGPDPAPPLWACPANECRSSAEFLHLGARRREFSLSVKSNQRKDGSIFTNRKWVVALSSIIKVDDKPHYLYFCLFSTSEKSKLSSYRAIVIARRLKQHLLTSLPLEQDNQQTHH